MGWKHDYSIEAFSVANTDKNKEISYKGIVVNNIGDKPNKKNKKWIKIYLFLNIVSDKFKIH